MASRANLIRKRRRRKATAWSVSTWFATLRRHAPLARVHRRMAFERLEVRQLLDGAPWQNPVNRFDVDDNHLVMPGDVLTMINDINARESRELPPPSAQAGPPPYLDVNGDNSIDPADVLDCINFINALLQESVPPTVTVDELSTAHSRPTLTGTVTDPWPTRGIESVTVTAGGQTLEATISGSAWSATVSASLADGTYDVQARATDWAGNVGVDATSNELIVDTMAPTVTINQAAGQLDPSTTSPIFFTVIFSEAVSDFSAEDVTVTGTAPGDPRATVTPVGSDGTTYTVAVGGIIGSGTVVAGILAGAAHDAAGNGNAAPTSTDNEVTCNFAPLFADAELEQAVREALGFPAGEYIDRQDLLALTTLSVDSNVVTSLVGLEHATNLQSLRLSPENWSAPPGALSGADPLAPLAGLTSLETLTLSRADLTGEELASLNGATGLRSLDVRYNAVSTFPDLGNLGALSSLSLYGNPLVDTSSLAGRVLQTDLIPSGVDQAGTVAELAAALHYLPTEIFEYVVNHFEYEPYSGAMKGPQAVLETGAGNDWDIASLLADMLSEAGIATRYVSGQIEVPIDVTMDYLGVTDPTAASRVLANAGIDQVLIHGPGGPEAMRFGHTWLEAELAVPGVGLQWVAMDPSWKFKDFQPGVPDIATLVPFDETGYLSQTRTELAYEYYERQVRDYLNANAPGIAVSQVPYDGPIRVRTIDEIPSSLPYTIVGATDLHTTIPSSLTHRVRVQLDSDFTSLFDTLLTVPEVSLDRLTISYAPAGWGSLIPQFRKNGTVIASGPPISSGSTVELTLTHFDSGDDVADRSFTYSRTAGQYLAIGLDARQVSDRMIVDMRAAVNVAAIARTNGQPFSEDDQIGGTLHLAIMKWFHDTDKGEDIINGLTHAAGVYNSVASGITAAETTVNYFPELQISYVPEGLNIDVANNYHQEFPIDNDSSGDATRALLAGYSASAQEHAIWEELVSTEAISTIKSLQLANERGIPIFEIDSSNAAIYLPQLTHRASIRSAIQAEVFSGATVTVPRDETPLQDWSGVGYITRTATREGYIINGGLNSATPIAVEGGFIVGFPFLWPFLWFNPFSFFAGDPVNVANGSVRHQETDVELPGVGIPLNFARQYDSANDVDRGLGPGWSFTYSDRLDFETDGSVTWFDDAANRFNFAPDGSGGFTTPVGVYGTLTAIGAGFLWRDKTGNEREFDAAGNLVRVADRYANGYAIAYDGSGQIHTVSDLVTPSRTLDFAYTSGHITAVTDFTGRTWSYAYDGKRLSQVTTPSDAMTPVATTKYDYYTDTARDGLLHAVTQPNGGITAYSYYPNRRAFQVTDPLGFVQTTSYNGYRNQAHWTDERGNTTAYTYNAEGNLIAEVRPDRSAKTWTWSNLLMSSASDEFGQAEYYQYDALGNLTQLQDRAGFISTFAYEPVFHSLTRAEQPGGRVTQFAYDADGNPTTVTDAEGNVAVMTHDARGQMLTYTAPQGVLTPAIGDYTVTYTYNCAGQTVNRSTDLPSAESFSYDARGNMLSWTDANGHTMTYDYDLLGRQVRRTDPLLNAVDVIFDTMGDITSVTGESSRTTRFLYDLKQQLVQTVFPDGTVLTGLHNPVGEQSVSIDELGRATRFTFDTLNRVVQTTYADGATECMQYDAGGRVVRTADARGYHTRHTYDVMGRRLSTVDALGQETDWSYDEVGNVRTMTDALGHTTTYAYDLLDRRTSVEDALHGVTTTAYDANGNLAAVIDPLGRTIVYAYDVLDRRVTVSDDLGNTTTTGYDPVGNVTSVLDPLGHETTYAYDPLNRLTTATDAQGGITTIAYDAAGNVASITDPENNTTTYTYDLRDRVLTETNQLGLTRSLAYDAVGNQISITDRNGRIRTFVYDLRNRETAEIWLDSSRPIETIRKSYDAAGSLLEISDSKATHTYKYDELGQNTSVTITYAGAFLGGGGPQTYAGTLAPGDGTVSGGGGEGYLDEYAFDPQVGDTYTISFESNDFDTYLMLIAPSGVQYHDADSGTGTNSRIELTIDEAGTWTVWATSWPLLATGDYTVTIDDGSLPGLTLDYTYDAAGNVTSVTDSLGGSNTYVFDELNRVRQIAQFGTGVMDKRVDFDYDAAGQLTSIVRYADLAGTAFVVDSTYTFDSTVAGRLIGLTHASASATLAGYTWTFDNAGRIVQMTSPDGVSDFLYDDTNQLTVADHNYQDDEGYAYDANGNRTGGGYVTGPNNRLVSDGTFVYEYDNEGNLIARTDIVSGAVRRFEWDHLNRLVAVTDYDASWTPVQRVVFRYDALGRRIAKSADTDPLDGVDSQVTYFVYDRDNILLELEDSDGAGPLAAQASQRYLHGPAVDQVLAGEDAVGNLNWLLADHQGTIRDIVDSHGTLLNHRSFDSFGNITAQTNPAVEFRYAFTGREFDPEVELCFYRARYYEAAVGRFLGEDPSRFEGEDSNLYRYVRNGPINFVDPTGKKFAELLETIHLVLDIIGAFEPTPFADSANAIIYLIEGDFNYAGISALGIIPYLGDAAKVGKYGAKGLKAVKLWSKGPEPSSVHNAFKHFLKHGDEFSDVKNAKQYVEKAHKFVSDPPPGTLTKVRPNGEKLFYDPNTNTFAAQAADGAPKTMFKPENGMDYWNNQ